MGWLDVAVTVLGVGFGIALAVVLLLDGASVFHAGLALFVFVLGALWWTYTSYAGETLRRWREGRSPRRD